MKDWAIEVVGWTLVSVLAIFDFFSKVIERVREWIFRLFWAARILR